MNASKESNLENMNIWPTCKIQVINEKTWKYDTVATVDYTPNAIQAALQKLELETAWVKSLLGREFVSKK